MTELSSHAQKQLLQLKEDYIASLPEKIGLLEACLQSDDLEDLRMQCHKIAGSSASFELPDISFAAQTLEALCKTRLVHRRAAQATLSTEKTIVNAHKVLIALMKKYAK